MPVMIRLRRVGKRGFAQYRVVVVDKHKKRDGAYIEKIGTYNPHMEKDTLSIDQEKLKNWVSKGAQLSEGLQKLMKKQTTRG